MPKVSRWRLFWTIVSIGAAVYVVLNNPVNLGLDLRGGTQIVLEAQDTADVVVDSDVTARTLEVLRRRVDAFGVSEPTLQVSGDRRIIIEMPGVDDPDEALEVIGRTAQLTFHPVLESIPTGTEPETPEPTAAADAAPAAGEIPTEQDFEEKAATEVNKDNVEAEVEKLEKELATEGAAAGGDKAPAGGDKAPAGDDKAPAGGEK